MKESEPIFKALLAGAGLLDYSAEQYLRESNALPVRARNCNYYRRMKKWLQQSVNRRVNP